jgi:hypothetical protein
VASIQEAGEVPRPAAPCKLRTGSITPKRCASRERTSLDQGECLGWSSVSHERIARARRRAKGAFVGPCKLAGAQCGRAAGKMNKRRDGYKSYAILIVYAVRMTFPCRSPDSIGSTAYNRRLNNEGTADAWTATRLAQRRSVGVRRLKDAMSTADRIRVGSRVPTGSPLRTPPEAVSRKTATSRASGTAVQLMREHSANSSISRRRTRTCVVRNARACVLSLRPDSFLQWTGTVYHL